MTANTTTARRSRQVACEVRECDALVHGRGLCRIHYDEHRYLASTARSPDAAEAARREVSIEDELCFGCVAAWQSPHGTGSMFASESERVAAWEARREKLLSDYLTPPLLPGSRPAAWWDYEAGRPEYLREVDYGSHDLARTTRQSHEREVEKVGWLAANGHLTEPEFEAIERRADEARERIGTPGELKARPKPGLRRAKLAAALGDVARSRRLLDDGDGCGEGAIAERGCSA